MKFVFFRLKSINIDLLFLVALFISIFFSISSNTFVANLWLLITACWGLIRVRTTHSGYSFIDLGLSILGGYIISQYCFFSPENAFRHYNFTKFFGFAVIYIQIKGSIHKLVNKKLIYNLLLTLPVIGFFQCILATLQYFQLIKSSNPYFDVVGWFNSPNHLGVFIALSLIVLLWFLFYGRKMNVWLKSISTLGGVYFLLTIGITTSRTAFLVLISGVAILLIFHKKCTDFWDQLSKNKKKIFIAFVSLLFLIIPYAMYSLKKESADGRLLIAKIMTPKVMEKPILGHGIFSFVKDYNTAKSNYFNNSTPSWNQVKIGSYAFDAYNDYLFFVYESGFLFIIIIVGIFIVIVKAFNKKESLSVLGLSIVIPLIVSSLFMPITSILPILFFGIMALVLIRVFQQGGYVFKDNCYTMRKLLFFTLVIISASLTIAYITNTVKWTNYLKSTTEEKQKFTKNEVEKMYSAIFDNGYASFNYGYDLFERGDKEEGIKFMEYGTYQNVAPKLIKGLAYTQIRMGNYKASEELLNFNTGNEPYRYEPLVDLFDFYKRVNEYDRANLIAKRIIELGVKIPSKEIDDLKKLAKDYINTSIEKTLDIKGTLSDWFSISSLYIQRDSNYRVYIPSVKHINKKVPVVFMTDGQHYSKSDFLVQKIDSLIENRGIEPIIIVFVDPRDPSNFDKNYRQKYFLCNNNYVNFIEKELLPEIELYYPVSEKREKNTILGHSFGGLFSAYLGMEAPDSFKNIAMQSPAFHPCKSIYDLYSKKDKLDLKIYMSYGTGKDTESQDLPMIKILKDKGYELKVNRVEGGNHDWDTWMSQIEEIMLYFYKI